MRGSAGQIGMQTMVDLCERLEALGESGSLEGADTDIAELAGELGKLERFLEATWQRGRS